MRATCPAHLILLDLICLMVSGILTLNSGKKMTELLCSLIFHSYLRPKFLGFRHCLSIREEIKSIIIGRQKFHEFTLKLLFIRPVTKFGDVACRTAVH
jgi:hypothetical protein